MLTEWTKLNKKLKELKEKRSKISEKLETYDDKAILLRSELEQLQKELGELVIKLQIPVKKEIERLGKKMAEKISVTEYCDLLNSKLEKIEENQEELLEKNGLTKEWYFIEKKRLEKQKEFDKKISELRVPIMREIGEWRIKRDKILSGKEGGSVIECDSKIRELYKKYNENWKNVLGPINEEMYKLTAMQRILLRKEGLIEKWDKLEEKKKEVEEKKKEVEEKIQKNRRVKKLERKINKIRNELDKIYEKRKRLIDPFDLEIVKVKQKLKELENSPEVKRWIKLNKSKLLYAPLNETKLNVPRIGFYSLSQLVKTFDNLKRNATKRPYYANWRLVGACNSRCIMCDQWRKKEYSKQKFGMKDIYRLLKELKRIGVCNVYFNGGEASLLKELPEIVEKAKDFGFFAEIKTNGSNLTEKYITKLYEAGLDAVNISLDGHNAKIHNKIRGIPIWIKVVKAIEFIKKNTEMEVRLNTLILKDNYKRLDKMIDLAKKLNIDSINFSQVDDLPFKNNKDVRLNLKQMNYFYFKVAPKILEKSLNSDLNVSFTPFFSSLVGKGKRFAIKQLKRKGKKLQEELKNFVKWDFGKNFYTTYSCYTPSRNIEIMPNGDIYPCCTTMNIEQFKMGNVYDQSLKEIWNSKKFKNFRIKVMNSKEEICKKCQLDFETNKIINEILK